MLSRRRRRAEASSNIDLTLSTLVNGEPTSTQRPPFTLQTDSSSFSRNCFRMPASRMKTRAPSPHRDPVSPVPSYYSEPAYRQNRKDVTRDLPLLPGGRRAHPSEEEEERDEETLSLRSMPSSLRPTCRRPRGIPKRQPAPVTELQLPAVTKTSHHDYRGHLEVRGTGYTRCGRFPPILKSTGPRGPLYHDRLPGRTGNRPEDQGPVACGAPEKEGKGGLKKGFKREEHLSAPCDSTTSKVISDPPPSKTQRIMFHDPVVRDVYPITPDTATQTRRPGEDGQILYLRELRPRLRTDSPPPHSSVWTDPKALTQGKTGWTEPRAQNQGKTGWTEPRYLNQGKTGWKEPRYLNQGRREVLFIRLGISLTKADSISPERAGPQYYPVHPLKPSPRRVTIPSTRWPRDWRRLGTRLGSLSEEEGCLSPPVPVQCRPGLLEPFAGFPEHLCQQLVPVLSQSTTTQLQDEVSVAGRQGGRGVQDLLGQTQQTSCCPLLPGPESPGGLLPKIIMTRPTPSPMLPRLLSPTDNRHAA
ncbi:hypothetical protein DPEC_G00082790 [Dallia pectoralis]|uniref:Uncharacterized protein n=1 Tax=Dallia pectoralis TaxID=75939 RepID=A0ACC2GZF5_DALPE|nr:hypothetical protein DPEC_G00082790 [Dallia pectoralis]